MCCPTLSSCAEYPVKFDPTTIPSLSPRPCRRGSPRSAQRRPTLPKGGGPWENGYIESFDRRLRDELLDGEIFHTLKEAKIVIERCRRHYNAVRPHASPGYRATAPRCSYRTRRVAGGATPTSFTGHARTGTEPNHELTFKLDHSVALVSFSSSMKAQACSRVSPTHAIRNPAPGRCSASLARRPCRTGTPTRPRTVRSSRSFRIWTPRTDSVPGQRHRKAGGVLQR